MVAFELSPALSAVDRRSEEHTSELQSQSNLVCRLLLEKKTFSLYRHLFPRPHVHPYRFILCTVTVLFLVGTLLPGTGLRYFVEHVTSTNSSFVLHGLAT